MSRAPLEGAATCGWGNGSVTRLEELIRARARPDQDRRQRDKFVPTAVTLASHFDMTPFWGYKNYYMKISFDPRKRGQTLKARGLDFVDSVEVFRGTTLDAVDDRKDYGEERIVTVGHLRGRLVVIVWTPRGDARRIISMRKANDREAKLFRERLAQG